MKKMVTLLAMSMLLSAGAAFATPYIPPAGPLYIQYSNMEQIALQGNSGAFNESNWGVVKVSNISVGSNNDPQNFSPNGDPVWVSSPNGQITGIFAGINYNNSNGGAFNSKNGTMYLYWDDPTLAGYTNANLNTALASQRTGQFSFTNFTDGILLAKIDFVNGAILNGDSTTSITGTASPTTTGFTGFADSYGSVDTSVAGVWTTLFDSDYFHTALGNNTADVKMRSNYSGSIVNSWNDYANGWAGAESSDPVRGNVVPEPATMVLLGAGMIGIIAFKRRKKSQV